MLRYTFIPIVIITHEPWTIFAQITVSSDIINKIQTTNYLFAYRFHFVNDKYVNNVQIQATIII